MSLFGTEEELVTRNTKKLQTLKFDNINIKYDIKRKNTVNISNTEINAR